MTSFKLACSPVKNGTLQYDCMHMFCMGPLFSSERGFHTLNNACRVSLDGSFIVFTKRILNEALRAIEVSNKL